MFEEIPAQKPFRYGRSATLKQTAIRALRDLAEFQQRAYGGQIWRVRPGEPTLLSLEPGWYHSDETEAEHYGPFSTFEDAAKALHDYSLWLEIRQEREAHEADD